MKYVFSLVLMICSAMSHAIDFTYSPSAAQLHWCTGLDDCVNDVDTIRNEEIGVIYNGFNFTATDAGTSSESFKMGYVFSGNVSKNFSVHVVPSLETGKQVYDFAGISGIDAYPTIYYGVDIHTTSNKFGIQINFEPAGYSSVALRARM